MRHSSGGIVGMLLIFRMPDCVKSKDADIEAGSFNLSQLYGLVLLSKSTMQVIWYKKTFIIEFILPEGLCVHLL